MSRSSTLACDQRESGAETVQKDWFASLTPGETFFIGLGLVIIGSVSFLLARMVGDNLLGGFLIMAAMLVLPGVEFIIASGFKYDAAVFRRAINQMNELALRSYPLSN